MSGEIQSRRADIQALLTEQLETCGQKHAGLWLDKYMPYQLTKNSGVDDPQTPQKKLVDHVSDLHIPEAYQHFFQRWQQQLHLMRMQTDGCEYMVQCQLAVARGRIAIGLGDESVIETAITLHHTYGVPYLPGSALKGLASAYAHQCLEGDGWRKNGEYHRIMFGTTDEAGYITFFDALYVPDSGHKCEKTGRHHALWPDVITVHHKDYYTGKKNAPPADWDSPTPIPFLTATGCYLVALGGPQGWVSAAFDILALALDKMGIGAKTSSGYGRMTLGNLEAARKRLRVKAPAASTDAAPEAAPVDAEGRTTDTSLSPNSPKAEATPSQAPVTKPSPQQSNPQSIHTGMIITGQRKQPARKFNFKGQQIMGVQITPREGKIMASSDRKIVVFVQDNTPTGGFRGEVIDIDDSNQKELLVLVQVVKKPKVKE